MMKMTRDLLSNTNAISKDAQNLYAIGAVADGMGRTESFDEYFHRNYIFDEENNEVFGNFFTDEQAEIYKLYTHLVAVELYKLNHSK